ncbi:D-alanyl-D-alanine carboxypeptidase, partial [Rhizobium ruizarguesonis]
DDGDMVLSSRLAILSPSSTATASTTQGSQPGATMMDSQPTK